MSSIFRKFYEQGILQSWWVVAFVLLCGILYERGLERRDGQSQLLTRQLAALGAEKQQALERQRDLQLQINSQSDLAWIELTLMKGLGLAPEGQQKVYFFPAGEWRGCKSDNFTAETQMKRRASKKNDLSMCYVRAFHTKTF